MKKLFHKEDKFTLDREIERVLQSMSSMPVGSDSYKEALVTVTKLCEARGIKSHKSLSTDTVVSGVFTLAGIVLVLYFEKAGVVTSKAFGLIGKGSKAS